MRREKKYTHVNARCYPSFKYLTQSVLRYDCGCTISDAYNRFLEGKRPLCFRDKEAFEMLSDAITIVMRMAPTGYKAKKGEGANVSNMYNHFFSKRAAVLNDMESFRDYIEKGSKLIYLYTYDTWALAMALFENPLDLSIDRDEWIEKVEKYMGKLHEDKEAKKYIYSKIEYYAMYHIRVNYANKKSDSDYIRSRLDAIAAVNPKITDEQFSDIKRCKEIAESYKEWKKAHPKDSYVAWFKVAMGVLNQLPVPTVPKDNEPELDELDEGAEQEGQIKESADERSKLYEEWMKADIIPGFE